MNKIKWLVAVFMAGSMPVMLAAQETVSMNVRDLTAWDDKGGVIEFEWTVPGDDGTAGKNPHFEITWSKNSTMEGAAKLSGNVKPSKKTVKTAFFRYRKKPGLPDQLYFVLKTLDKNGKEKGISNTASGARNDSVKADIFMNRANDIFYADKKDYKAAVEYFVKAKDAGARVKDVDLLFKIAFCYNKLGDRRSKEYFDRHLENQQYYYMIKAPYEGENPDLSKYGDFLAGISFLGPAFTEKKKKDETVMYVPDNWVQKFRAQGTYLFLFYVVDYAYCYGDFPGYFVDTLFAELDEVLAAKSKVTPAYVYSAVAAHYLFNRRYEKAWKYYKLASEQPNKEEEYAKNLKSIMEKIAKLAGIREAPSAR